MLACTTIIVAAISGSPQQFLKVFEGGGRCQGQPIRYGIAVLYQCYTRHVFTNKCDKVFASL